MTELDAVNLVRQREGEGGGEKREKGFRREEICLNGHVGQKCS
jgi:hypothetical protein